MGQIVLYLEIFNFKTFKAEILQIFELLIWRIDDFINSFWLYLTFSRSKCSNFLTLLRVLWSSISNVYLHTKGVSFALQTLSQGCLMVFSAKYRICHVVHIKGKANSSSLLKPKIPTTKISSFIKEGRVYFFLCLEIKINPNFKQLLSDWSPKKKDCFF